MDEDVHIFQPAEGDFLPYTLRRKRYRTVTGQYHNKLGYLF